jgi:hypothetical protein
MQVKIIPWDLFEGRKVGSIGSSVIRAHWLADAWDGASIWKQGEKADVYVFQKVVWASMLKDLKNEIKIFDACDPDHLSDKLKLKQVEELFDAVVTSSPALRDEFARYIKRIPVVCIPDRVNLKQLPERKKHSGKAGLVGWYGYYHNASMIFQDSYILNGLARLGLNFKVISNGDWLPPYRVMLEIENVPFDWSSFPHELQETDIVINPTALHGSFKYKSNNKTIISWALGLPVANNADDLKSWLEEKPRQAETDKRYQEVLDKWDIKYSVAEYQALIKDLCKTKNRTDLLK